MNKEGKIYLQHIRCLFPMLGIKERKYLKSMRRILLEYLDENENASLEQLCKEFGNPQDVVRDYYATDSTSVLVKRIKKAKCLKFIVIIGIIGIIVVTTGKMVTLSKALAEHVEEEITQEEEVIY